MSEGKKPQSDETKDRLSQAYFADFNHGGAQPKPWWRDELEDLAWSVLVILVAVGGGVALMWHFGFIR